MAQLNATNVSQDTAQAGFGRYLADTLERLGAYSDVKLA
jgi:hypothetical protein